MRVSYIHFILKILCAFNFFLSLEPDISFDLLLVLRNKLDTFGTVLEEQIPQYV